MRWPLCVTVHFSFLFLVFLIILLFPRIFFPSFDGNSSPKKMRTTGARSEANVLC
jgi:hypothetical protein